MANELRKIKVLSYHGGVRRVDDFVATSLAGVVPALESPPTLSPTGIISQRRA